MANILHLTADDPDPRQPYPVALLREVRLPSEAWRAARRSRLMGLGYVSIGTTWPRWAQENPLVISECTHHTFSVTVSPSVTFEERVHGSSPTFAPKRHPIGWGPMESWAPYPYGPTQEGRSGGLYTSYPDFVALLQWIAPSPDERDAVETVYRLGGYDRCLPLLAEMARKRGLPTRVVPVDGAPFIPSDHHEAFATYTLNSGPDDD